MRKQKRVPPAVIRRLPYYLRALEHLQSKGVTRISSGELSSQIGYTASQIRQDFNHFGAFGQQGYGYNVESLRSEIMSVLGLTKSYSVIVVGCGRLGRAISHYNSSAGGTFKITAFFDSSPDLVGKELLGLPIRNVESLSEYLEENETDIGIITVTKDAAGIVAQSLVRGGVRGIWNFTSIDLDLPKGFPVCNVHLYDGLQSLVYYINHAETNEKAEKEIEKPKKPKKPSRPPKLKTKKEETL